MIVEKKSQGNTKKSKPKGDDIKWVYNDGKNHAIFKSYSGIMSSCLDRDVVPNNDLCRDFNLVLPI